MRLLSCRLRQVRRHRDLSLSFGHQLTVVGGANEAGKSTLVEALHKGLFLRSTATGAGVEELRSRLHAGLPEVEIRFEAEGQVWQLRKRFAGASGTCQLSHGDGLALGGAAAEEKLAALLGVEGPVGGRQLTQLPERWGHLWVRQGDGGRNPIGGSQASYDALRLMQRLQERGGGAAMASDLDRQVLAQLQADLDSLQTSTGKVRAGSPLALALQRRDRAAVALDQARARLVELGEAMEELGRIGERLATLEQRDRPELQARLGAQQAARRAVDQLEAQRQLAQAELQPLLQRQVQLHQDQEQRRLLGRQLAEQRQRQGELERQGQELQRDLSAVQQRVQQQRQEVQGQELQRQTLQRSLERARLALERLNLGQQHEQLLAHRQQLATLQQEAEGIKEQLAQLPPIQAEDVRRLRRLEQALREAEARRGAMAASLELLKADQAVVLNGHPLAPGQRVQLAATGELQVGDGVRLRLHPGGGDALPQAEAACSRLADDLARLAAQLGVDTSEAAERIERQRQGLEQELGNRRQAASTIPWSGLEERIAALGARRQRLEQTWQALNTPSEGPADPSAPGGDNPGGPELEAWMDNLRSQERDLAAAAGRSQQALATAEGRLAQLGQALEASLGERNQLAGSLQVLADQDTRLEQERGATAVAAELEHLAVELERRQRVDADLQAQLRALGAGPGAGEAQQLTAQLTEALEALDLEKESLLTRRGQADQRCAALGAVDPAAELERCQADWELAEAEATALERHRQALVLLQERFHRAQDALEERYSTPLTEAVGPYLQLLPSDDPQALLRFDPQQGFQDLQLRQGPEAFAFDRLSYGMREQLAAALRLAMAEVLQPAYGGCLPLVFDDAFTNSDRDRLEGLKRMVGRATGQGVQVVLLTCHPEDYTHGGKPWLGTGSTAPLENEAPLEAAEGGGLESATASGVGASVGANQAPAAKLVMLEGP